MITKTIGQLDTETNPSTADYIPIEHGGVTEKVTIAAAASGYSSTAEAVAGTSNSYLMTPLKTREAFNCTGTAPVYACRAFVTFNGLSSTGSITGTYTRTVGTTTTVLVATAHGYITGNVAYVNFTTGGASANTYTVTKIDNDSFSVQTVSTSSVLSSAFSIKRSEIYASGNVGSISYIGVGLYYVNFMVAMPDTYYAFTYGIGQAISMPLASHSTSTPATTTAFNITVTNTSSANIDYQRLSFAFFR
jgi:hypothetical protein